MLIRLVYASIYGVPPGYTGSPLDGTTCATMACHRGPVTTVPGWITTTIPPNGYLPSDTYTVTLTATRPGTSVFGFQITAQGPAAIVGEFLITDGVQTQYSLGTGYVTHKAAGSSGIDQKSWQMKWIAPPDTNETGVTFYAAMVVGYFDQDDEVFLSTRAYTSAYQSVGPWARGKPEITCYPLPFGSFLNVEMPQTSAGVVRFDFFSPNGALLLSVSEKASSGNSHRLNTGSLPEGVVFMVLTTDKGVFTSKLIKKE
ncbi:MAG: choice-of-anchor V domain-containing protein [Bacteroidales bacterium]